MSKQSAALTPQRDALIESAARAAADFGAAAGVVDEAASRVLRVNPTDLSILGVLYERQQLAASEAAAAVGLSPAATSTAIQRLLAAGHLTRATDPTDRRRAVLALTRSTRDLLARIYEPIGTAGRALLADYHDDELRLITAFLERGRELQNQHAARTRKLR